MCGSRKHPQFPWNANGNSKGEGWGVTIGISRGMGVQTQNTSQPQLFQGWTVSICAKISVFPLVQANKHTLTTAKFGSVQKTCTTFNMQYILDPVNSALSTG